MEALVKAATAPWWSSTEGDDLVDATDAAWVRRGQSDSVDSCRPRPSLDEDPRRPYAEEVKDAPQGWTCGQCTFLNVKPQGACGVCGSVRPPPPPPPEPLPLTARKAKLGRGSGLSPMHETRLAALLNVDAESVVVVAPGYEPPAVVAEGLHDDEDDEATVERPKSGSLDGANEQEAYGVAVALLVDGLKPADLALQLQDRGWSATIAAKVARDLNKLQAGAATAKAPSKPSPDALNAMLAKRRPPVKKDEAPDPLQAYLKMRKFGVAAEGVLARMQMDGSFLGVLELASTRVVSRTPSRRRRDACQHTQRSRPAPRRRRDTAPPQAAPSRLSSGFER